MNSTSALARVSAALETGAQLRLRLAKDLGATVVAIAEILMRCHRSGGWVFFCGNGGSAADAQHLAAELVGRFVRERQPLCAVALTTDSSILTAIGNDYGFEQVFARQVVALGRPGDVLVAISTSGNAPNVLAAARVAKERGLQTVGLTGRGGGTLAAAADLALVVPSDETARIQECHLTIGHLLCELVDDHLFLSREMMPAPDERKAPKVLSAGSFADRRILNSITH